MTRRVLALFPAALALLAFHHSAAATGPQGLAFVPTAGCRAVDTRLPAGPNGGPSLGADEVRVFKIQGTCGVPASALGLAVNVRSSILGARLRATLRGRRARSFHDRSRLPGHKTRAGFALVKLSWTATGPWLSRTAPRGRPTSDRRRQLHHRPARRRSRLRTPAAAGTVNTPFSQTFTSAGGTNVHHTSPLRRADARRERTLAGTPTQSGSFPIVVTATDANGCKGFGATHTLVISARPSP